MGNARTPLEIVLYDIKHRIEHLLNQSPKIKQSLQKLKDILESYYLMTDNTLNFLNSATLSL